ncbi:MAG: tyrosine-type recombinase/integrase [Nitrospina sp.]|nr:tyrosine-type recombinase/integrase [Nitrospina sp.]
MSNTTKKLTDAKIRGLPKPPKRTVLFEEGTGFGLRLEPSGRKSFILFYWFNGKKDGVTLGRYPKLSLADARAVVAKIKQKIERGEDPKVEIKETQRANRNFYTVGDLCHEYIERHAKVKKKSWKEDQRILAKDIIPIWNRRKASDIKRKDVIGLLDNIVERGAAIQANRTLAVIRRMFNFSIERDILEFSPCTAVKAPAKENIKDRVLSDEEIKALWGQLDKCESLDRRIALSLKLMLITGQRKVECLHLKITDIDKGWWSIPKEISKNGKPHRIFLSPQATEIISLAKELLPESDLVFPSPRTRRAFLGSSIDHALRETKVQEVIKVDFTPHDLRRTASSMMTSMGIPRLTVSKILNHSEAGVTAKHYDHYAYDKEKKEALIKWGKKVEQICGDK